MCACMSTCAQTHTELQDHLSTKYLNFLEGEQYMREIKMWFFKQL